MIDPNVRARRGDPSTSKEAGAQVTQLRASQARVLAMFKLYGDMTDAQLATYLHDAERTAGMKLMSPSGIRSRRSELSKPNMERLADIVDRWGRTLDELGPLDGPRWAKAREQLRIEGFRSALWDTGRRELRDGRSHIVWGLAR